MSRQRRGHDEDEGNVVQHQRVEAMAQSGRQWNNTIKFSFVGGVPVVVALLSDISIRAANVVDASP